MPESVRDIIFAFFLLMQQYSGSVLQHRGGIVEFEVLHLQTKPSLSVNHLFSISLVLYSALHGLRSKNIFYVFYFTR